MKFHKKLAWISTFPGKLYHEFYSFWVFNTYLIPVKVEKDIITFPEVDSSDEKKIMPF
jgi:hypothetical protein